MRIKSVEVIASMSKIHAAGASHCGRSGAIALAILISLAAPACSPNPPSGNASPQGSAQDVAQIKRAKVSLGYIRHGLEAQDDGVMRFGLSDGTQVELTRLAWVISDVELHACPPQLGALERLLLPHAYAHVPDSSTRHGAPFVEDLLGPPERARMVGELGPPYGRYCTIYLVISPADEDIINATALSSQDLNGYSYWIAGRLKGASQPQWRDFEVKGTLRQVFKIEPINPKDKDAASLTLEDGADAAFILIDKDILAKSFEPLAASVAPIEASLGDEIISALAKNAKIYRSASAR